MCRKIALCGRLAKPNSVFFSTVSIVENFASNRVKVAYRQRTGIKFAIAPIGYLNRIAAILRAYIRAKRLVILDLDIVRLRDDVICVEAGLMRWAAICNSVDKCSDRDTVPLCSLSRYEDSRKAYARANNASLRNDLMCCIQHHVDRKRESKSFGTNRLAVIIIARYNSFG